MLVVCRKKVAARLLFHLVMPNFKCDSCHASFPEVFSAPLAFETGILGVKR